MSANAAPPAGEPETPRKPPRREPRDIRSSRPRLLSRRSLAWGAQRLLSITALIFLDIAGLALGLMMALVLRALAATAQPVTESK